VCAAARSAGFLNLLLLTYWIFRVMHFDSKTGSIFFSEEGPPETLVDREKRTDPFAPALLELTHFAMSLPFFLSPRILRAIASGLEYTPALLIRPSPDKRLSGGLFFPFSSSPTRRFFLQIRARLFRCYE